MIMLLARLLLLLLLTVAEPGFVTGTAAHAGDISASLTSPQGQAGIVRRETRNTPELNFKQQPIMCRHGWFWKGRFCTAEDGQSIHFFDLCVRGLGRGDRHGAQPSAGVAVTAPGTSKLVPVMEMSHSGRCPLGFPCRRARRDYILPRIVCGDEEDEEPDVSTADPATDDLFESIDVEIEAMQRRLLGRGSKRGRVVSHEMEVDRPFSAATVTAQLQSLSLAKQPREKRQRKVFRPVHGGIHSCNADDGQQSLGQASDSSSTCEQSATQSFTSGDALEIDMGPDHPLDRTLEHLLEMFVVHSDVLMHDAGKGKTG